VEIHAAKGNALAVVVRAIAVALAAVLVLVAPVALVALVLVVAHVLAVALVARKVVAVRKVAVKVAQLVIARKAEVVIDVVMTVVVEVVRIRGLFSSRPLRSTFIRKTKPSRHWSSAYVRLFARINCSKSRI
jgi:hypothetical protein